MSETPRRRRTVLVIEDNELNREILCSILEDDYQVLEAENGLLGLEQLRQHGFEISLILLDIQMPVMNGYEFLEAFSGMPQYATIPIIVTTSSAKTSDEIHCLDIGASDFVTKPYNPDIVLKRAASMIRLSEASAMLSRVEFDSLTHVYSREFFYENGARVLDDNPEAVYDLFCCDVENFKLVNDRYGSRIGDEVLCSLASAIRGFLGPQELCGRIAGDVFAVLMIHENAVKALETITNQHWTDEVMPAPSIVIKYGVCERVEPGQDLSAVCDRARLAIDNIKRHYGKNCAVYNEETRQRMLREQQIISYMEQALDEHQFVVYYQPKHNLKTGRIGGSEALVRWIHPQEGFMNPGEFIPLFERNGFVLKVDQYVWEETCRSIREWLDAGYPELPVSVNISRVDFALRNLDEIIEDLADRYQVPHRLLHLEVTESAYTENLAAIDEIIHRLHDKGFCVELDDFGAGYSSLSSLSELPLDIIKLDMSLVRKMMLSSKQITLLRSMIGLADSFEMLTTAEGVETEDQAQCLKEMGCTYAQGYLYAKPLPKADFEAYMKQ